MCCGTDEYEESDQPSHHRNHAGPDQSTNHASKTRARELPHSMDRSRREVGIGPKSRRNPDERATPTATQALSGSTGKIAQTNIGIEHVRIFESMWRDFGPPERLGAVSDQVEQRRTSCAKGEWDR